jgi:hypothetical protein
LIASIVLQLGKAVKLPFQKNSTSARGARSPVKNGKGKNPDVGE